MLGTILIVILLLALVGALPRWSHSREWGYAPTGGLGLVLFIVIVLLAHLNLMVRPRSQETAASGIDGLFNEECPNKA